MPPHRYTQQRRTQRQVRADERAARIAAFLGRALKSGRMQANQRQADVAAIAGISQSAWSDLERGKGASISIRAWIRAADAVGSDFHAYLEALAGTDAPRDAVHLGLQELVARTAAQGGWLAQPELMVSGAGWADVLLSRGEIRALIEIWTWLADVGEAFRSWDRKLQRLADAPLANRTDGTQITGCWVLRATRSNRELVAAHATLFEARFPGEARGWLRALGEPNRQPPSMPGLLWVSAKGDRLASARR